MSDVIIIGCGIVGSAIAYELSKYNLKITILEKCNDIAEGATKANSAIIHAGYDPEPGTLMARLNVRGSELAEKICRDLDVPYKKNGAMVLAFNEEDKKTIETLYSRGVANGVKDLSIITGEEVRKLEPNISENVVSALYARTSAICSPWEYCLAMTETAVRNGAELKLRTCVTGIERCSLSDCAWSVHTDKGDYEAQYVINAAGCESDKIHDMALGHEFDILPNRGEYYLLDKSEGSRVNCTIFQCPSSKGKGVLVSPTVHGNLIVGPNIEAIDCVDTATTKNGLDSVKAKSKESVPSINFRDNIRNFSGVRAKSTSSDFIIELKDNFVDAAGICSPGLSSAPAIGEYVAELLAEAGVELAGRQHLVSTRKRIKVKELGTEEKAKLIAANPAYGDVVCRCETITRGEILDCFKGPVPPCSVDGVKRRVGTGMGRCQGGFCAPIIVEMLAENLGVSMDKVIKDYDGSEILFNREESLMSEADGVTKDKPYASKEAAHV